MTPTTVSHAILNRTQKNLIHAGLLMLICVSLALEGGKVADWGFVAMALFCEGA